MIFVRIVSIIRDDNSGEGLYAVRFPGESRDEFERLFDLWLHDVEFLYQFFLHQQQDLRTGYYKGITVEEAIRATRSEAKSLRHMFVRLAREGLRDKKIVLDALFQPLHNNEYRLTSLQKSKARGIREKRWLRIYAIRFAANCFVITGGAIKLTLSMAKPHLQEELYKLEKTRQFLISNNLRDQTDFEYLEI